MKAITPIRQLRGEPPVQASDIEVVVEWKVLLALLAVAVALVVLVIRWRGHRGGAE